MSKVQGGVFMTRIYLLLSAAGLFPVALSYGIAPAVVLPKVLDLTVEGADLTHILRAVMGLYLAMIVLWVLGALRPKFARAAVMAEVTFMFGLAAGRVFSILIDGVPSILLVGYTAVEIGLGYWGILILKKLPEATPARI
jgi:hypothetical protein